MSFNTTLNITSKTFLVMAAGTGGHVYPALEFAEFARKKGHKISWLGTSMGLEKRVVPASGIELNEIDISGVRGRGMTTLLAAPIQILKAIFQAKSVLEKVKPDLVIGFGGYIAGPGGVASKLAGIPLVIHEQNAIAGTTNKLLSRIATKRLCAFDGALPDSKTVGNPVRNEIFDLAPEDVESVHNRSLNTAIHKPLNVLVVGGSLGARFLNDTVPAALATLAPEQRPVVCHQSGPKLFEEAAAAYEKAAVEADIKPYIEDMAEAYQWADLVICRAGAMTISELAAAGVASMLVPFPFAIDDHQTANAKWLVDAGAAEIYQQSENDLNLFAHRLVGLIEDADKLTKMAKNAAKRALRDSTPQILEICENLSRDQLDVA